MTYEQAKLLVPHESFLSFAGANFRFAGLLPENDPLHKGYLMIFDEPPSIHVDRLLISSCELINGVMMMPAIFFQDHNNTAEDKSFENAARPLIKWLCENKHPHVIVVVTPTGAELAEGIMHTGEILDYVMD